MAWIRWSEYYMMSHPQRLTTATAAAELELMNSKIAHWQLRLWQAATGKQKLRLCSLLQTLTKHWNYVMTIITRVLWCLRFLFDCKRQAKDVRLWREYFLEFASNAFIRLLVVVILLSGPCARLQSVVSKSFQDLQRQRCRLANYCCQQLLQLLLAYAVQIQYICGIC